VVGRRGTPERVDMGYRREMVGYYVKKVEM
jgi:hypothetical protein